MTATGNAPSGIGHRRTSSTATRLTTSFAAEDAPLRKAAILLVSLEQPLASQLLAQLDRAAVEAVTLEIARLERVGRPNNSAVLEEFYGLGLRRLRFVFEDLVKMDDRDIREAYHDEDSATWALALAGAARPVRAKVLGALPAASAEALRREPGPPRAVSARSMRKLPRPRSPNGFAASMTMADSPFPTPTVRRRSLSDLVEFEDLELLDGTDLRAVFDQVPEPQVLDALCGSRPGIRQQLLTKLPSSSATRLEAQINAHGPVSFESVYFAQRAVVETLCRLSRGGQVAFDDPEDMVA